MHFWQGFIKEGPERFYLKHLESPTFLNYIRLHYLQKPSFLKTWFNFPFAFTLESFVNFFWNLQPLVPIDFLLKEFP